MAEALSQRFNFACRFIFVLVHPNPNAITYDSSIQLFYYSSHEHEMNRYALCPLDREVNPHFLRLENGR